MADVPGPKRKLETWKEVAAYLGKNERTVKRWEASRDLPVHRLPGDSRSRIYAVPSELDAWMQGIGAADDGPNAPAPIDASTARRGVWTIGVAAVAGLCLIGGGGVLLWTQSPRASAVTSAIARPAPPPPSVEAQRLYVEATEAWARRTPDSLNDALGKFNAAIGRDPDYAEAYAGLAKTYILLREYTVMPEGEAYTHAKNAAERAIALNDGLPDAHAALGFVAANWLWEPMEAEHEYRRAIELDPRNSTVRHWFGTFLLDQARPAEGLKQLDAALALEPGSASIRADRALVLDYLGQQAAAIAALHGLEAASPNFKSPHEYLSRIYFESGRDEPFFEESERAALLSDDLPRLAMISAGRRAFATGGHRAALLAMRDVQIRQMEYGDGSAYAVALTDSMLGDDSDACRYLGLSRRHQEPKFAEALASPMFTRLRKARGSCEAIDQPLRISSANDQDAAPAKAPL